MGDFIIRIDSLSSDARQLTGVLEFFDLHQYVDFSTHIPCHSLDYMILSIECNFLSVFTSDMISDHFSVNARVYHPKSSLFNVSIEFL